MTQLADLHAHVRELLGSAAAGKDLRWRDLPGGRNNRVYRIDCGAQSYLLKQYFRAADDPRDRLYTEFGFSTFLSRHGIRTIPAPLAMDPGLELAMYEFVPGRRLSAREVTSGSVETAMEFFAQINRLRHKPEASAIPAAAEACFTLSEHLQAVAARVRRVCNLAQHDALDQEVQGWANTRLLKLWQDTAASAAKRAEQRTLALKAPLVLEQRCLSPSDFGFHNAILTERGELVFHDFEYAGWDDPAKFVADFFSQPDLPVPHDTFAACVDRVLEELGLPDWHRDRIEIIMRLYRVKWCCIVLNDFLEEGGRRRRFASAVSIDVRGRQFDLARQLADACESQWSS